MIRPSLRLSLALVGLVSSLWLLHHGADHLAISISNAEPGLLVVALARWAALATGWYLVAVTVVGALARFGRLRSVVRLADIVTMPALRRLLDASLGVSVLAGVVSAPAAWADEHPPPTMRRLSDAPSDRRVPQPEPPPPDEPPPDEPPPDEPPPDEPVATTSSSTPPTTQGRPPTASVVTTTTSTPSSTPALAPATATTSTTSSAAPAMTAPSHPELPPMLHHRPEAGRPPPAPSPGDHWAVARGDHFWSIAERVLTTALQRVPTDAETDAYWRALVEANRDRLADRHNPDLLFAGQVLVLPPRAPP